jgi:dihydroneopterin aldolase
MKNESHCCVFVEDQIVNVRIGLHVSERKPQRLKVQVSLYADPVRYLSNVSVDSIVDYNQIHAAIATWPGRPHTDLVETYAREILDLAFSMKDVTACAVKLSKMDIYPDAAGAGIDLFLTRRDYKKLK